MSRRRSPQTQCFGALAFVASAHGAWLPSCTAHAPAARPAAQQPARLAGRVRMVEPALVADAASQAAAAFPAYQEVNVHTMANLVPDMINTVAVAGLGLAGAYVTRVRRRRPATRHAPLPRRHAFAQDVTDLDLDPLDLDRDDERRRARRRGGDDYDDDYDDWVERFERR